MMHIFIIALVLCSAYANDDVQHNVKSVKGGFRGGYNYNPANYPSFGGYNLHQNASQHGYAGQNMSYHGFGVQNTSKQIDFEVGVCYIEVPTASLVRNPSHIPAGNGSRPDLSRIRTCCKGYIRNIYNFKLCDPVCSQECVNALCTAPETCTCFADHVKNLGGFCIPTCPIGCQNGHCSGGECLCKEGFKLDSESKYCIPSCRENCGGVGNCTASNVCQCKNGYESTREGNCKPVCNKCENGECVAPNDCRCRPGYVKNQQGLCEPQCPQGCGPGGRCIAPNLCDIPVPTQPTGIPGAPFYPPYQTRPSHPGNQINNRQPINPGDRIYPDNQNLGQNIYSQDVSRNPLYPGNQVYPGNQSYPGQQTYPGHQIIPGNQLNPGNQGPGSQGYPGNRAYPAQVIPGNQMYPGNQGQRSQGYPGNQVYPGQVIPGNQVHSGNPGQGSQGYPGNQVYPGQVIPGNQVHSGNPGQGSQGYPGNQVYPGQVIPGNPGQGSQSYPGNQVYPGHQSYPGNQIYPGNQGSSGHLYPGNQVSSHNQSVYGSQVNQSGYQSHYGSRDQNDYHRFQGQGQSENQLYPDIQQVDLLQCAQLCINGQCVDGIRCQCNPGYVLDVNDSTQSRCMPYCPGGCPNGICSGPHLCICNVGYYKDTSVKGRSSCVKRSRRSIEKPTNIADLLIFDVPDDY